ncbi:MAG: 4Fe-4S cluster-binding domain-containing protein [Thermodesulfobacteriota bacterium]|nr:4Fe-4S cluster-binding domain-containing protein [Thermodesulfobacteriota bacterium]
MGKCNLCPRHCNIDRAAKEGICQARDYVKIGAIVIHKGEEPPFVQGEGSGAIFFSGCPLRCEYCQNKEISHANFGIPVETDRLAQYMIKLQRLGCSNINLVSPTHYTPWIIKSLTQAKRMGLSLPIIINSSGYEQISTIRMWYEHAHIYLIDLKYGDNRTGKILSKVSNYWDIARKIIEHIWKDVGPLIEDTQERAVNGLLIRHLLLPGMLSNPFAVLEFLADISLKIPISIMSQYNPTCYRGDIEDMKRAISKDEYQVVLDKAISLGFETIYTQEIDSAQGYLPEFHASRPFGDYINLLTT